ncbi:MAG: helix-turn-helix domain-containing protein [Deltaproteobacteria bacterium]|nr:helix-turn-helix domain-containing protein [Deltaproteobacteria bacterium]
MRHILCYKPFRKELFLASSPSKRDRLHQQGLLNPHPERVQSPAFQSGDFFDADDLLQVKYEMLRHARIEGASKAEAAALFGMSRPTFYQAEAAFASEGLPGLVPKRRGPKGAHKLGPDVMAFIEAHVGKDGPIQARSLAQRIEADLGLRIHPRSIERALGRKKKR